MAEVPTCVWHGQSGTEYTYYIYALPATLNPSQNGNYIYAQKNEAGRWVPIYIGQGDLADRASDSHHQAACIKRKGATHIHCHLSGRLQDRQSEEEDLLARYTNAYQPHGCNEKPGG